MVDISHSGTQYSHRHRAPTGLALFVDYSKAAVALAGVTIALLAVIGATMELFGGHLFDGAHSRSYIMAAALFGGVLGLVLRRYFFAQD